MKKDPIALKTFVLNKSSDDRITVLEDSRVTFEQTVLDNLNAIAASIAIVGDELIELRNLYNAHTHGYTDVDNGGVTLSKTTSTKTIV